MPVSIPSPLPGRRSPMRSCTTTSTAASARRATSAAPSATRSRRGVEAAPTATTRLTRGWEAAVARLATATSGSSALYGNTTMLMDPPCSLPPSMAKPAGGRGGDPGVTRLGYARPMGEMVGRVIGTEDATPLEFWVAVAPGEYLQLDDVVALERILPTGEPVRVYGMVSQVRARHEGARFDSDVFLISDGVLPAEVSEAAKVTATRFEPEVFVPPRPGQPVARAEGDARDRALFFDRMERRLAVGLTRENEPLYINFEFLNGERGAHVNISGVSGVATKTTYATFLLHSLFTGGVPGPGAVNTKAVIFNVKGEDLLHLDRPNNAIDEEQVARYRALGLPADPFKSVGFYAPPRVDSETLRPDVHSRQDVTSFCWSLAEFCQDELLPFLFADAEDDRAQYTMVVYSVMAQLKRATPRDDGSVTIEGTTVRTFRQLADLITQKVLSEDDGPVWAGTAIGRGTINAFVRRLNSAVRHVDRLIRGNLTEP